VFQELDKLPPGFMPPTGRTKPWGTGHAILMAADLIRGPFAVINGDDFYGINSFKLLSRHFESSPTDSAMVGFVLKNTLSEFGSVARGICRVGADNLLETVTERTNIESNREGAQFTDEAGQIQALTGREIASMNMWGFTPAIFAPLQRLFIAFL